MASAAKDGPYSVQSHPFIMTTRTVDKLGLFVQPHVSRLPVEVTTRMPSQAQEVVPWYPPSPVRRLGSLRRLQLQQRRQECTHKALALSHMQQQVHGPQSSDHSQKKRFLE
jgi:hypothetical protein